MRMHGIYVPLVTPFEQDGSVAVAALEELARAVLAEGAAGLVALGTTGEPALLTAPEKSDVLAVCGRVCRELGAPLIVGAGGGATEASARELEELAGLADAALVPTPPFVRPSPEGVLAHFTHLAERSPVPLIVYDVPYRTACALDAQTLHAVGRLPAVIGAKLARGAVDQDAVELLNDPPPGFAVLAGDDVFLGPLLSLGAAGGILASAHLAMARFVEFFQAWENGDLARARVLGRALTRVSGAAFAEPNPAVVKAVLAAQGRIPSASVRLPLMAASEVALGNALAALSAPVLAADAAPPYAAAAS
ncbi:dihydrodipicolinate synthase family protein [Actinospica sp. MGRD01-02]|uniref:Dihydrodipicolinate synthase family protein n=1 Tax=Actinospica acidithermotolerans TaxID=2828514 RepID=A0A941EEB7_9ACTN|nr:dihydrodipicolinate synthase family protein [Actinospica acidithermotolerans]MBR7829103.1 dihydrodipicolinate synthase family protein [Actinospica acidithermotolerans]